MEVNNLKWEYLPKENPDWDFARNLFTALKRPQGSWTQSIFSVRHENLIAPNRDYRFQGLCSFVGKDYWKFLDCIFFGIKGINLEPVKVIVFPWKCIYQYSGGDTKIDVEYYLTRDLKEGLSARVLFDIKNSHIKELIVKPLIDIRNVFSDSSPQEIETKIIDNHLVASRNENSISFFIEESNILAKKEVLNWRYKLGSGFREQTNEGVKFISEFGSPIFAGEISKIINGNQKVSLIIDCNRKDNIDFNDSELQEKLYLQNIAKKFDCKREILARIITLDKFGIFENNKTIMPEAGDFWFRQIWLRDLLECLINNFQTFMRIDNKHVEKILKWILKQQDKTTGRFPNFRDNYNSTDASLLVFLLAEKYMKVVEDKKIGKEVLESLNLILDKFSKNKIEVDGMPVFQKNLLLSMPWHSWTDSRIPFMNRLVSTRIPSDWLKENLEESCKQALLPEINALFIRALKAGEFITNLIGPEYNFIEPYKKALSEYKKVFKNKNYLFSIVMNDKKDSTETSMALVSSVLLYDHLFNKRDLERMWPTVEKLLVKKRGKVFGILTRNVGDRVYFNDYQYHGAVVWPRDTPYLIKYLRIIGEDEIVKEILESNLHHQMDECAIFYCNELFSLPEGKNPSPNNMRDEPVPVKNPIQLWSHFCDEYLSDKTI